MTDGRFPAFRLTADGAPFAPERVLSITISDEAGFESDELVIILDDADPQIARPRQGALLTIALGYDGAALTEFGTYTVEEVERSGWPRRLTLTAKAADHAKAMKEPKTRAWEDKTLGDLVKAIAGEHGLKAEISSALASVKLPYIAQTEESDQHLLTRIGKRVGTVIAPKDQRLLVTARHSGKTVSGQSMPEVKVTADMLVDMDGYRIGSRPRGRFGSVRTRWRDRQAGLTRNVDVSTGLEGPRKTFERSIRTRPKPAALPTPRCGRSRPARVTCGFCWSDTRWRGPRPRSSSRASALIWMADGSRLVLTTNGTSKAAGPQPRSSRSSGRTMTMQRHPEDQIGRKNFLPNLLSRDFKTDVPLQRQSGRAAERRKITEPWWASTPGCAATALVAASHHARLSRRRNRPRGAPGQWPASWPAPARRGYRPRCGIAARTPAW